jgi:transcriptional regulator with XRE-family HTH domain
VAKAGTKHRKEEAFLELIGKKVYEYRKAAGMSQTELAMACHEDTDYSQIARIEKGKVNFTISYLKIIADALGITPQDLLP